MNCEITYQVVETSYYQGSETKSIRKATETTQSTDFGNCETKFWLLPKIKELIANGASVSIIKMQRANGLS